MVTKNKISSLLIVDVATQLTSGQYNVGRKKEISLKES